MTTIAIPESCLVVLIGASGSGKSTFAHHHFLPTEILSSDTLRAWVSDDESDQSASQDAFDVLHTIAKKRLARMKLTVIDATNVQPEARRRLVELAQSQHTLSVAIVLNMSEKVCLERNIGRANRDFGDHVIKRQRQQLYQSLHGLEREGFRAVHILKSPQQVADVSIIREPLWCNLKHETGPFDIIGDIHGCYDELVLLLKKLGYEVNSETHHVIPPEGRKAIFVGDLIDRGLRTPDVLKLVMNMVKEGHALCGWQS